MTSKAILLIEDNPSDIELTQRAFMKEHIPNELVVAEDGQAALDYLFGRGAYAGRDVSQRPALILLDLKLPVIDGLEVLRRIRADPETRRIVVIVLTSSSEEKDIATSYDYGANSYLRKPVDYRQFVEIVRMLGSYWLTINEPPYH